MDQNKINKVIDLFAKTHNVLVLGNGFDMHLGLKSSFSNFFEKCVLDKSKQYNGDNLLYLLLKLRFYRERDYAGFFRAVDYKNPNWMDVEGFVKKIATEEEMISKIYKSHLPSSNYNIKDTIQLRIDGLLYRRVKDGQKFDYSTIKKILSEDLDELESDLIKYLKRRLGRQNDYIKLQEQMVDKIIAACPVNKDYLLQIIDFNYTTIDSSKYCCEANVHGTLNTKIVVGYDSTGQSIKDNDIFELSKEWRKLDVDFSYDFDRKGVQAIIIYGHSLGEQDYPYFFELFDMCDFFYKQNYGHQWKETAKQINLYICYSRFGDKKTQNRELQKLEMNVSKLLNAYERYRYPELKRNTIVTNLKIKKQISFIEIK